MPQFSANSAQELLDGLSIGAVSASVAGSALLFEIGTDALP